MNQAIECFHFLVSGRCILSECLSECAQTFDHSSLLCCDCCFHLNPVVFTAFNEVYLWFGHLDRMHTRNTFMSVNFSRDLHVNPNPSSLLLIYNGIYIKKVYNSTYKFEFCLLVLLSKQKSKELKCCSLAFQNANDWRIWRERLFIGSGYVIAIFRKLVVYKPLSRFAESGL